MDLVELVERIFPPMPELGYAEMAADVVDLMAATVTADEAVGPFVLGELGRWIGHGDPEPDAAGIALLVDESSDAAQAVADTMALQGEEVDVEGQPCYRYVDESGNRYLGLATPGMLLLLIGQDDGRIASVAEKLFRRWREDGSSV